MTDPINNIDFFLIDSINSVEEFLKLNFGSSGAKLKKYFDKKFLVRSFGKHSVLSLPLNFVNDGEINPNYSGPEIEIIYEDEYFLVMNKPADLFVHPLVYNENNNCLSFLRKNYPKILNVNKSNYDRGLLYRLDFETSGVLIFVKKDEDYHFLREHFGSIAKKKIYKCIVDGECKLSGSYTHYFSSKDAKGKKVIVSFNEHFGLKGSLEIVNCEYDQKSQTTLVEIELKSGLRHQIRAQMAHLGFPLRGDVFYGGQSASRLYLHAYNYQIEFKNKVFSFTIDPNNFQVLNDF